MKTLLFSILAGFALGVFLLAGAGVLMWSCGGCGTWGVLAGRVFDVVNWPLGFLLRTTSYGRSLWGDGNHEQAALVLGLWWGLLGVLFALLLRSALGAGRKKG